MSDPIARECTRRGFGGSHHVANANILEVIHAVGAPRGRRDPDHFAVQTRKKCSPGFQFVSQAPGVLDAAVESQGQPRSPVHLGWAAAGDRSMIDSRRCPYRDGSVAKTPSKSGPRETIAPVTGHIATVAFLPSKRNFSQIPAHVASLPGPCLNPGVLARRPRMSSQGGNPLFPPPGSARPHYVCRHRTFGPRASGLHERPQVDVGADSIPSPRQMSGGGPRDSPLGESARWVSELATSSNPPAPLWRSSGPIIHTGPGPFRHGFDHQLGDVVPARSPRWRVSAAYPRRSPGPGPLLAEVVLYDHRRHRTRRWPVVAEPLPHAWRCSASRY